MSDDLLHPDFKDTPYWWEAAPPSDRGDADPPAQADVLIVGGGYAGLSAALELARGGRSVVVAEAEFFGHGASSRNGGHVSSGVNLGKGITGGSSKAQADSALRRIEGLLWESRNAFDKVGELVEREKFERQLAENIAKHRAEVAAAAAAEEAAIQAATFETASQVAGAVGDLAGVVAPGRVGGERRIHHSSTCRHPAQP